MVGPDVWHYPSLGIFMNESKNVLCEDQRHHLDIVEAQITRMSENSKQMKSRGQLL